MKKVCLLILCLCMGTISAFADDLRITISVDAREPQTKIVGADIYAVINGNLTEITISPDKLPFKMNAKVGAFRLKSFWMTENQAKGNTEANK